MLKQRSYQGYWSADYTANADTAGVLEFNPNGQSRLNLLGNFGDERMEDIYNRDRVIYGFSVDGKELTLIDCYQSNNSIAFPGIHTISYSPQYIIVGAKVDNPKSFLFHELTVEIELLTKWLDIWGYSYGDREDESYYSLIYKLHNNIEFQIDDLDAAFIFAGSTKLCREEELSVSHKAKLRLKSKAGKPLVELLEYAWHFKKFLTIATESNTYFKSIHIKSDHIKEEHETQVNKQLELLYKQRGTDIEPANQHHMHFLFTYTDIAESFNDIIQRWFDKKEALEPIINTLYEGYSEPMMYLELRFLNVIQALEVFHRRFVQHTEELKAAHNTIWASIKGKLPDDETKYLNRFEYAYEPSLPQRLKELIKLCKIPILDSLLGSNKDAKGLMFKVALSRNYYTHYELSKKNEALQGQALHSASERLKVLLLVAVLKELGLSLITIDTIINKDGYHNYRYLMKPATS